MKTFFCSFGLLMAAVPVFAQNTGKDSIVSTKALNDVVVSASNISRVGDQNFGKDTLQLREVVVRATRPLAKLNSEGFVTEVKGTVLEKLGFAKDIMGMLPGVLNNNGSIEVFGKGKPVFYINGHIVRNNIEVEQLKANQIDKITVITNPSSRYASTVGSIIKITTIKKVGDGFSFDNIATFGCRNYMYGKDNLDLNYRIDNLDVFGTLGF